MRITNRTVVSDNKAESSFSWLFFWILLDTQNDLSIVERFDFLKREKSRPPIPTFTAPETCSLPIFIAA